MQIKNEWKSFGGIQKVYTHHSEATGTPMDVAVYEPPTRSQPPLVLYFLSGLTCTWQNFVTKAAAQRAAAEHNVMIVCPDTSPRGSDVPDLPEEDGLGQGAGFYLNATQEPWNKHFKMHDYVRHELPRLVEQDRSLFGRALSGHSMGGHGALTLGLLYPEFYSSVSAFSPIVNPSEVPWGKRAFTAYLGADREQWLQHDACHLVRSHGYSRRFLIDQGSCDPFLERELTTQRFVDACSEAGVPLELRMQNGYDHSYYFIASFISDHIAWHCAQK